MRLSYIISNSSFVDLLSYFDKYTVVCLAAYLARIYNYLLGNRSDWGKLLL